MRTAAALAALAAAVTSAACGGAAPSPSPAAAARQPIAEPLPALELPLLEGGTWSAASARGQVLVIDVWASWCAPCRKGFPALDALAARPGTAVVAISIDEEVAAIRSFLASSPVQVPIVHDAGQSVTRPPLAIGRLPTVLVVDASGVIRHRIEEPTERDYASLGALVDEVGAAPATAVGSADR